MAAWEHDGAGWAAAGPTWPEYHYAETNIEDDGHVPASPTPWWAGNGNEHARAAGPRPPVANLQVEIADACAVDCMDGPVELAIQVANVGLADVPAGAFVSVFTNESVPLLLATAVLDAVPSGIALAGMTFDLPLADVALGVRVVVDDDGTGTGAVTESDEGDNVDTWDDVDCP